MQCFEFSPFSGVSLSNLMIPRNDFLVGGFVVNSELEKITSPPSVA